jgi:hypothetical protein
MEQERFPIGKRTYFHDLFFDFGVVHGLALEPYVRLIATASLPALSRARTLRAAYELLPDLLMLAESDGSKVDFCFFALSAISPSRGLRFIKVKLAT